MCLGDEVVDSRGEPTAATFHQPARFLTADCGVCNPSGYIYSTTPNLRLRDHLRRGAGKNRSTRGPGQPPGDSVFSIWQGSFTHNDTTRWHASQCEWRKYPKVPSPDAEILASSDGSRGRIGVLKGWTCLTRSNQPWIYTATSNTKWVGQSIFIYTHMCIK